MRSGALLVAVPGALLLATRAVQTSFLAPVHLLVVLGAWLVLIGVGWALLRGRVPWGVVAAAGGVLVARCALALLAMSSTGPGGYWYAFYLVPFRLRRTSPSPWPCSCGCSWRPGGRSRSPSGAAGPSGTVLAAVCQGWAVPACVIGLVGLERALTAWNDQVGLLPSGLPRILGITVYLGTPVDTAWWAAGLGAVLLLVGCCSAAGAAACPGGCRATTAWIRRTERMAAVARRR